jgi:hypothetical protein
MAITLALLALSILLVLNVRASKLALSEADTTNRRILQLLFVWLLPFVGAIVVDGIHRGLGSPNTSHEPVDPGEEFGMSGQGVKALHESLDTD